MEAGGFARQQFRAARRAQIRREWRGAAKIIAAALVVLAIGGAVGGDAALVAAMLFGFTVGVLTVLWYVGDPHALTWLWGAEAEEATAEELGRLDPEEWTIEHDVVRPGRGNWDHIVSGAGKTYMLETKHTSNPARVANDELLLGRRRVRGSRFRGAAVDLKEARGLRWVQAVVVIWGEFPQRVVEHERVVYVDGDELVGWLQSH